jgi:hypothetical protein
MDKRYHGLTYTVRQKQFDVYLRPGRENLGDYRTKHHSGQHHTDMHGLILHEANILQVLRECVKLLPLPQPHLRTRTYTQTYPSAKRATHFKIVMARVYYVSIQNLNTNNVA